LGKLKGGYNQLIQRVKSAKQVWTESRFMSVRRNLQYIKKYLFDQMAFIIYIPTDNNKKRLILVISYVYSVLLNTNFSISH